MTPFKSWFDEETSLFCCVADNYGTPRTYRQVHLSDFAIEHEWYCKDHTTDQWVNGSSNDLDTIIDIRAGRVDKPQAKLTIQCYTPSALFECKKRGSEKIKRINRILQLEWDGVGDPEQLKQLIFSLPFVGLCALSVSGKGVYALIIIEGPDMLVEYAEHCFEIFRHLGIPCDTTKGRNYSDLRFVSYDAKMLYREDPTPLKVKRFFKAKPKPKPQTVTIKSNDGLERWAINQVGSAQVGNRFEVVRRVSYAMGGHGFGLDAIKDTIRNSSQYLGVEQKYLRHADECFKAGSLKPIPA